jgi:O-antigen ligase
MKSAGFEPRRVAAAVLIGLAVIALGPFLDASPGPILATAVLGAACALLRPEFAFACFISGGVWKTAAVFGAPDSLLPTAAILLGWSASVALRNDLRERLPSALRATFLLVPLALWLFVSTYLSETDPLGYREATRFLAVAVVPSILIAVDLRRGRMLSYAGAACVAASVISLAGLGTSAILGTFWTKELVLFGENQGVFGRLAALGFVAGMCLLPISRRPLAASGLYVLILVCATAVAHSTSRGAALAGAVGGIAVVALLLTTSGVITRHRLVSALGLAAAWGFMVASALTFFPTGRGVQTLTALPSNIEQFVQVPLLSQSLPTPLGSPSVEPSTTPVSGLSPLPPLVQPTAVPTPTASHAPAGATRDPAAVYESDLSLAYRIERYRVAIAQFEASPLIGVGFTHGVFARDGQDYVHNIFLEVASELGLIGLACLAFLLVSVAAALVRARSDWEVAVAGVLLLCAFVAAQTSGNLTINRLFFILCIALVAHARETRERPIVAERAPTPG